MAHVCFTDLQIANNPLVITISAVGTTIKVHLSHQVQYQLNQAALLSFF